MLKWITIVLAILLIGTNGFWLYSAIDLAVTEKYRQQIEYENENQIVALSKLNSHFVKGMPKDNLNQLLTQLFPEHEPFEKEGYLNTLWLSFKIGKEGKIEALELSPYN